jgi:hypothetical protein
MYQRTVRALNDYERAYIVARMQPPKPNEPTRWEWLLQCMFGVGDTFDRSIEKLRVQAILEYRELLEHNQAIVHQVQSTAVSLTLCEGEDLALYFFDIGNGQLLGLYAAGKQWADGGPGAPWPSTNFKFVHTVSHPDSLCWIYSYGDELIPASVWSPTFLSLPPVLRQPFVINGTINSYVEDMTQQLELVAPTEDWQWLRKEWAARDATK